MPHFKLNIFIQTKVSQLHDAVIRGSLPDCQKIVADEPKKKLHLAKDSTGTPLLHKAVYYDHQDIVEWLVNQFPDTVQQKDRVNKKQCKFPFNIHFINSVSFFN